MLNKDNLKSFGLVEAVVAIFIVVIMLVGVVSLSSSSLRSSMLNSAYLEAEHIADNLLEQIVKAKAEGKLSFLEHPADREVYSIDCFDWENITLLECLGKIDLPYKGLADAAGYIKISGDDLQNPGFSNNYFSWRIEVKNPSEQGLANCREIAGEDIPQEKCRFVEVDVKWLEQTGEKNYYQTQYFTDWEN